MAQNSKLMQRLVKILLVEDDQLDQMEVQRTLDRKNILYKLKIAINGEDALRILSEDGNEPYYGKPDIILVDLNMPKMNGFEFLDRLKANAELKDIKVFILTTSEEREDKSAAHQLGISGFITKPLKLESPSSLDAFNLMIDLMNMQVK
jgi:CheY-like chemotaxis protein